MALHRKNEVADFSTTITNSPGTGGLTITLASTTNLSAGMLAGTTDWYATCVKASVYQTTAEAREIVLVTAMSGSDATVTRAQFGTTALDLAAGDYIEIRPIPYHTNEWQDIIIDGDVDVNFAGITGTSLTTTGGGSLTGTWTSLGTVTTMDLNGGTIDATVIGGSTRAAGSFTSLNANAGGALTGTWSDLGTVTTVDLNGGTIDGTTIGGASAAAGTFTSLNASGGGALTGTWTNLGSVTTIDINGGTIDGTTIGASSRAAGSFTTISTNNNITMSRTSGNMRLTIDTDNGGSTDVAELYFNSGGEVGFFDMSENASRFRMGCNTSGGTLAFTTDTNTTALTINASQQSTFSNAVTVSSGNVTLTSGTVICTAGNVAIAQGAYMRFQGNTASREEIHSHVAGVLNISSRAGTHFYMDTDNNAATNVKQVIFYSNATQAAGGATEVASLTDGGSLSCAGSINTSTTFSVASTQVVGTRKTGWAAATGTATRTTFVTSTVTTAQLAERVKALIDDLISHGLIGT